MRGSKKVVACLTNLSRPFRQKQLPAREQNDDERPQEGPDVFGLLNDDEVGEICSFLGPGHFLYVAGTCKKFKSVYYKKGVRKKETFYANAAQSASCAAMCVKVHPKQSRKEAIEYIAQHVAIDGQVDVIKYFYGNKKYLGSVKYFFDAAAQWGQLEILEWKRSNYGFWGRQGERIANIAAEYGRINILAFLHSYDIHFSLPSVFANAAKCGSVQVLEWMMEQNLLDRSYTPLVSVLGIGCTAAMKGHVGVLEWFHQNGFLEGRYAMDMDALGTAAFRGQQVQVVLWAWQHGFRRGRGVQDLFSHLDNDTLLKFLEGLVRAGCPWGTQLLNYSFSHRAHHVQSHREEYERIIELGVQIGVWERT